MSGLMVTGGLMAPRTLAASSDMRRRMDGWTDGRMDANGHGLDMIMDSMDGWMDGWMDGQMDGR